MKYTFASLGKLESLGVRLGGAGLGDILFPWATAYFGSAISDMIALSRCKVLVSSASTFSMWVSFLGQIPTIWFPGQMRQKLIIDEKLFEGEVDYNYPLSTSIIQLINND